MAEDCAIPATGCERWVEDDAILTSFKHSSSFQVLLTIIDRDYRLSDFPVLWN